MQKKALKRHLSCCSMCGPCVVPVLRHADNSVFLGDDDRRAHNILESLDSAHQTWLPILRLNFGCHGSVVRKPPSPVLTPGNITYSGTTEELELGLRVSVKGGSPRCCDWLSHARTYTHARAHTRASSRHATQAPPPK